MVRIQQHNLAGGLNDLNAFLADVQAHCVVEQWQASVEYCLGEGALAFEERSSPRPVMLSPSELREAYRNIFQTVDGVFIGFRQGTECCRLEAVDSSFWEVSGPVELESHMLTKYGAYEPRRA